MQCIRSASSLACGNAPRSVRRSVVILAAVTGLSVMAPGQTAAAPWGWAPAGQAATAWTPQNLADYLLTGQTPRPAVARIVAPEQSSTSLGSGVLVDVNRTQGLVLTNWHVVRDSRSAVLVQFPDGFQSAGTVVRWDEAWDLAALVIWKPDATPVSIAAAPPAIGEPLTIAGFGRGPYREETGPCLDYLSPGTGYPREFLELQATARQGDSGGPIFNAHGDLAGVLFGQAEGRTIGSCSARVREFLAAVGSQGFVPRPIAEFSDARAIDRGIGLAAAAAPPERLADLGDQPLQRSAQVDAQPGFPVVAVALPSSPAQAAAQPASTPAAAWPQWPAATASKGPDLLAAAGGLALVVLGLRVLFGGRRRYDTFPTRAN
jgi:S1-C subfamily serine protease